MRKPIGPRPIIAAQYVGDEAAKASFHYPPTVRGVRTCATVGCGARLSQYNLGEHCSLHESKAAIQHINDVALRQIASRRK